MGIYLKYLVTIIILGNTINAQNREILLLEPYNKTELRIRYGGNLHHAIYDITKGYPTHKLSIVFDNHTGDEFINHLTGYLLRNKMAVTLFNLTTEEFQDQYFNYLSEIVRRSEHLYTIYFVTKKMAEHLLIQIYDNNLIRRNTVFMFYWGSRKMYRYFIRNMYENMKIILITNPRTDVYRLYYNQATSYKKHNLKMINWWIEGSGLFHHPTLPNAIKIYKNFHGRLIYVPVIHKPPWHFVRLTNESIEVTGGRDDKILKLLAARLNFQFEYFDPPDHIQGSSFNENGTFDGVLGLIYQKEAEFFIGDVALTLDRTKVVEFTFLTLADSGAFVTQAPSKLNEALALIRPFSWEVWPAIILTVILSGPVLYIIIATPNKWYPKFVVKDQSTLLYDCAWYTTGVFLKQAGNSPCDSHKGRFFIILLSVCATYVIGDMYAANLTSLLARPGREKPVSNLRQLEQAMLLKNYKLMVERHSSSFSLLENGTGIYGRLWRLMNQNIKSENMYLVDSVEQGVKLVKETMNLAVMAGRETLFFDIQRFGATNYYLSEKLNTAYSAIAVQLGCPYLENFNSILMGIFEAGILTKMTQDEYENLGKQLHENKTTNSVILPIAKVKKSGKTKEKTTKLQAINIRMLQGAFYLLGIGYATAGLILIAEIFYHRQDTIYRKKNQSRFIFIMKIKKRMNFWATRSVNYMRRRFREYMNDAIVATLEYTE